MHLYRSDTGLKIPQLYKSCCAFMTVLEQPFPLPRYGEIGDLPDVSSVFQHQFLHSRRIHTVRDVVCRPVPSSPQQFIRPFSSPLHHCPTGSALTASSTYTAIRWRGIWMGKKCFVHTSQTFRCTKFPMSWPLHTNLHSEQHLTDSNSICCILSVLQVPTHTEK